MRPVAFAARSLRREFFHGELATLFAALVLAVAALAAVATLASRVERAIVASAAELIGGDLGITSSRALPEEFVDEAQRRALAHAELADFPSVVFVGDKSRLCDVRAAGAGFPLRGVLSVRDASGAERVVHAPEPGTVYADHEVLVALGVAAGANVQVGGRDFALAGEIVRSPDSGNVFRLAPRLVMNLADAQAIGLMGPGSRVRHRLLVAGETASVDAFAAWAKSRLPAGAEITTVEDAQQNLRTAFERGESFLRLAALLAALLSGIAVALAAQRFARRKTEEVALLKCLGASRGEIIAALTLEIALLALPACIAGLALGLGLQQVVIVLAHDLLPGATPPLPFGPPLAAFAIGLAVLFGFALPPLLRLRDVEPMRVFRQDLDAKPRRFDALYLLPFAVGAALIGIEAGNTRLAVTLGVGFLIVALATWLLGYVLLRLLRSGGKRLPGALRFGLANLARRRALSLLQAGALALSLTALAVLGVIAPSLLDRWRMELAPGTPNYFMINLQPGQRDAMRERLASLGATNLDMLPLAVGKLVAINGVAPKAGDFEDRRARNWINGEMRLSWSAALPPSNRVREGRWFDGSETAPGLSVDMMWVEMFHLKLGDALTLRIGERDLTARIESIRGVNWDSFRVNFFLMLDPKTGESLPHSYIASFHVPGGKSGDLAALSRDFPNVSLIDINAILDRVRDIVDRVGRAAGWVLAFSVAAGVLVLLAALAATADERRFEIALLRTLGAHSRQLSLAVLGEFVALGLLAGLIAAIGAGGIGIALAERVFKLENYWPPAGPLLSLIFAAAALVAFAGWAGTLRIARTPPVTILRKA
ncbi:MAG TPA: FtsX-like permease family protein [Rhodanobacteraceae bacterium]|nr:FtsX-like permease family protein [Rhodanobacteraceae bacterium]